MLLPPLDFNWAYIIPILFILILVHEWGHFATARWVGIKVEEFGPADKTPPATQAAR